ncbi:hypothetical protein Hanom_Chr02g00121021 [Helianthus anomalus]
MKDIKQKEVVVEEGEHQSWPGVLITNAGKCSKPREKEMRRSPGNRVRDRRWSAKSKRKEPLKRDQSSCYMSRIRFMPGKFKFWWFHSFHSFQMFKIFYNSVVKYLFVYKDQSKRNLLIKFKCGEVWIVPLVLNLHAGDFEAAILIQPE